MKELILILICTYRRESLTAALTSLGRLNAPKDTTLGILVIDNDNTPTARQRTLDAQGQWPVRYIHAPAGNISLARNAGLEAASKANADWIAFIDDDETASPDWLCRLREQAEAHDADVICGPTCAIYPEDTPPWITRLDPHSNRIASRTGAALQTAHTSNALLRWHGTLWQDQRFDLERGQTGGEDTAFFFQVSRCEAQFAFDENAVVFEQVSPERLRFGWLAQRKFRSGQSYAAREQAALGLARLGSAALLKASYCGLRSALALPSATKRNAWALRGLLHLGVVAGCFSLPQKTLYGQSE